jgi:hypothetical protein
VTTSMKTHTFSGLDAQNPLGFLAALGLLRILDDHARRRQHPLPTLAFVDDGQQVAQVQSHLDVEAIKGLVLEDAAEQGQSRALRFAFDKAGNVVEPEDSHAIQELKPPASLARQFLRQFSSSTRREADIAAGFFSDLVVQTTDASKTKPTAFDFTAGTQEFLKMVNDLRQGITSADLDEALLGPWTSKSQLPSLAWDSAVSRIYALRATDPSGERRASVAGANWLAFQALGFFLCLPSGRYLKTTAVEGRWGSDEECFIWPLWINPVTVVTARALLRIRAHQLSGRARNAAGISLVMRSGIDRSTKYGVFRPSSVVPPPSAS